MQLFCIEIHVEILGARGNNDEEKEIEYPAIVIYYNWKTLFQSNYKENYKAILFYTIFLFN